VSFFSSPAYTAGTKPKKAASGAPKKAVRKAAAGGAKKKSRSRAKGKKANCALRKKKKNCSGSELFVLLVPQAKRRTLTLCTKPLS
jgi:hypothetical protein